MKDWTGSTASVFKTIGASNHTDHDRQSADYYATEPAATEWLCKLEHFDGPILEPSCGQGHISEVLIAHGYTVESRDLIDRGYGTPDCDFLAIDNVEWNGDIITNPPYRYALQFVERALQIIPDGHKVAMFLKLTFCEGKARKQLFRNAPPPADMGIILSPQVRNERRLLIHSRQRHSIRLVRLAERISRRHHPQVVQLTNVNTQPVSPNRTKGVRNPIIHDSLTMGVYQNKAFGRRLGCVFIASPACEVARNPSFFYRIIES